MNWTAVIEYIVLLGIVGGGLTAYIYTAPNTNLQFFVSIITAASYVAWGCIHHAMKKDLHIRVVIEYVLIGGVAVTLLATILGV